MATMNAELYDALRDAGASEGKSRAAAEAIVPSDSRFDKLDRRHEQFDHRFNTVDQRFAGLDLRVEKLDGRVTLLTWMVGTNTALVIAVLFLLIRAAII